MDNIYNIENLIGLSCSCGCTRFNLLKSGSIECAECREKITGVYWSEGLSAAELQAGSIESFTEYCERLEIKNPETLALAAEADGYQS